MAKQSCQEEREKGRDQGSSEGQLYPDLFLQVSPASQSFYRCTVLPSLESQTFTHVIWSVYIRGGAFEIGNATFYFIVLLLNQHFKRRRHPVSTLKKESVFFDIFCIFIRIFM